MFEDCLTPKKRNGRYRRPRALALFVSLIFHGFLVYGLYTARMTVKILSFEQKSVRSVMMVPPLRTPLPKVVGGRSRLADSIPPAAKAPEEELGGGTERGAGAEPALPEIALQAARVPPIVPQPAPGAGQPGSGVPSLATKFRDSVTSRLKPGGDSGLKITLSPPGSSLGPGAVSPPKGIPPDFYAMISGAGPGFRGRPGSGPGGRGSGAGGQRIGMNVPLKGYDIAPWAEKVLDRIQKNWELPPAGSLPETAKVEIFVLIKKSGELFSIEIVEVSSLEVLDQAALRALRASFPFPALPGDFPGDYLEIYFEFAYND